MAEQATLGLTGQVDTVAGSVDPVVFWVYADGVYAGSIGLYRGAATTWRAFDRQGATLGAFPTREAAIAATTEAAR